MKIPKGFKNEGKIACLNSAIYGLSQASRFFYQTLRNYLVKELKFRVCKSDACVLMKEKIILGLYVGDVLIVGDELEVKTFIESFKKNINQGYIILLMTSLDVSCCGMQVGQE